MSHDYLVLFSVAGLRPGDIDERTTPTLYRWASDGALAELVPTFPCVTSPVQVSMSTGTPPGRHGVIANGFFSSERHEVEFWVGGNEVIAGEQIWDALRAVRPDRRSAVWHTQNIRGAGADFIVTPTPIHEPDGTTKPWCYSKPEGLYKQLIDAIGHFPLQHYWGPLANIQSTRWILGGAGWLIERHAPDLNWIYIPHLDYAGQRYGPNSNEANEALAQLDRELAVFADKVAAGPIGDRVTYLVTGEYALTDVSGVIHPNRLLRQAGLLTVAVDGGHEYVDLSNSAAFAMVDHQVAHVYVNESVPQATVRVCDVLKGVPGIAGVYPGDARSEIGMKHARSGHVILVSDDSHWFAYYWWLDDSAAPPFAHTVDIHRKPGYDPVELFVDPVTKGIPLDPDLVKGSHGVPATDRRHRTALVSSRASGAVQPGQRYRDTDVKRIILEILNPRT